MSVHEARKTLTPVIVVLNAGSSSIKFSMFAVGSRRRPLVLHHRGEIEGIGSLARFLVSEAGGKRVVDEPLSGAAPGAPLGHEAALEALLAWIERHSDGLRVVAAGHRVVHGGARFSAPLRLDPSAIAALEELVPLAPLHQPHNLAAIRALVKVRPDLPQVACFDTAFHRTQPRVAQAFALPHDLSEAGIKRYGFHGLSYEYIAGVLPDVAGPAGEGRVVVAHLGNGCSMCAMRGRESVATTMSFTALDGLPMGTRCGSIDPGVVLYLIGQRGLDVAAVTELLYHGSGLLGMSGISGDMRDLLASDAPRAAEAIDVLVYRIGRELGSLVAALGGLDALVFTAGIGEHAAPVRARVCEDAAWLGVRLDPAANLKDGPRISAADSRVPVWVIPTNEELMIARHAWELTVGLRRGLQE
jgi:acetate kinase